MKTKKTFPEVPLRRFLIHSLEIVKNPLPFHHQNFEKLGDTFKLNIGPKTHVFFSRDAKFLEYVLQKNQKNYTKSKIQIEDVAKYVGKGLLTSEGEYWKTQRKLIQPAFHKKKIQGLLNTIQNTIRLELQNISTETTIDIFPIFNDLAFQVVAKSLFSSDANPEEIKRLQHITESAQKMLVKELRQPYLGWWFLLSGKIKKHLENTQEARHILLKTVQQRQTSNLNYNDLLDLLLDAKYEDGSPMNAQQLMDEILILFVAGHETTSNALTFTSQLLALHPEWQKKIYEEAKKIDSETDDLIVKVNNSKVCQQVIEESLRLYPPAYFIDRMNYEEDAFENITFKAGSNLLFSIYEIHRHPKYWEQPEAFLPERFAEGGQKFSSHYFPFGSGPRKCIGNNFAMFEMIIAVKEIVSKYKIHPKFDTIEITPLITLKPKNAFLQFEKR